MARSHDKKEKNGPVPHKILNDRGLRLERANLSRQPSNINHGKSIVVGQDGGGNDILAKIGSECPKCRKRIRGLNHAEGDHHKGIVPSHKRR